MPFIISSGAVPSGLLYPLSQCRFPRDTVLSASGGGVIKRTAFYAGSGRCQRLLRAASRKITVGLNQAEAVGIACALAMGVVYPRQKRRKTATARSRIYGCTD